MNVFEYVVCSTGNTTHNNVLALGLNNNRTLKSHIDENVKYYLFVENLATSLV